MHYHKYSHICILILWEYWWKCKLVRLRLNKTDQMQRRWLYTKDEDSRGQSCWEGVSRQIPGISEAFQRLSVHRLLMPLINYLTVSRCLIDNNPEHTLNIQWSKYQILNLYGCITLNTLFYIYINDAISSYNSTVALSNFVNQFLPAELTISPVQRHRTAENTKSVWRHNKWPRDWLSQKTVKVVCLFNRIKSSFEHSDTDQKTNKQTKPNQKPNPDYCSSYGLQQLIGFLSQP